MSSLRSSLPTKSIVPSPEDPRAHLNSLQASSGPLQRIGTKFAVSAQAGRALRQVQTKEIWAKAHIAETAIEIATARVCTALVATAMPSIGALAVGLNAATSAVDQSLTNSGAAEVASHIENRHDNLCVAEELRASGKLSDEEKRVVTDFIETDTADDIARARKRMSDAKNAVDALHGFALGGIEKTKASLQS